MYDFRCVSNFIAILADGRFCVIFSPIIVLLVCDVIFNSKRGAVISFIIIFVGYEILCCHSFYVCVGVFAFAFCGV